MGEARFGRSGKMVIVTGINGVGKTTVLKAVAASLPPTLQVKVFNYGDIMFRLAQESGLVASRDDLRKLPLNKQLFLQEKAAELLFEQAREGNIIVDTHALITTKSGFLPGLPKPIIERLQPDVIVVVEASPEEIFKRRMNDATRSRTDQSTVEEIRFFMELNRVAAISSAVLVGASVLVVNNVEGDASQAALKIVKLFTPEDT